MMTSDTPVFTYDSRDRVEGFIVADDIWSPPPAFAATTGEPLNLLVAAGGGTFQDGKSSVSPQDILTSTDALIFLSAIDIADRVTIAGTSIWRSCWYLPLGCNAPIGLTWKLDGLSFEDITEAATALCSKSVEQFMSLLERRRDDFVNWLAVVTATPASVSVQSFPGQVLLHSYPALL
jgi:hypothetical protein